MAQLLTKIRLLFVPYIILSLSIIFGYSLLNWLLLIQFEIISLNDDVVEIWIPCGLVILSILFVLYPRIKLLNLKSKKGDRPFIYCVIAAAAITLPTIIAQKYLSVATGKLTALTSIDSITQKPATKYYTLKNAYIAKQYLKTHFRFETTGKNNEGFDFYIDVVCPIFSSPIVNSPQANTRFTVGTLSPKAWLGIEYKRSVSNHLSSDEKETRFKDFVNEINKTFEADNLNDFTYLERAGNNKKRQGFIKAIGKQGIPLILEAQHEPFEARTGDKLLWLFGSFGIGAAIILIMTVIPKLDDIKVEKFLASDKKIDLSYIEFIRKSLSPKSHGFVTMLIITINVLVFVAMVLAGFGFVSFDSDDLLRWGANHGPSIADGEWWRLLTCTFLHGGLMHLLGNIYGLVLIALILEDKFTKIQFVSIYLLCGIGGSLSSLLWHPNSIGVGASGAIFGLYGVYLALYLANKAGVRASKGILIASLIFIGLNLLVGLTGNIDNAAHIGGLITGILLGFIFSFFMPKQKPKRKYIKRSKVTTEATSNAAPDAVSIPLVD